MSLTRPDSCTRKPSTVTMGSWRRVRLTACIATSNRSMVAEIPQTTGIGGYPACPSTSRLMIVGFSDLAFVLNPRCASSRTR